MVVVSKEDDLDLKIEIWPSNKIRYAYLYTNYFAKDKGQLGKSCMRDKDMQKSLNFYIKNNVRIVVVTDNKNKIHARALLWDNVKNVKYKKIYTYLDRVYTASSDYLSLFYKLAEENGWTKYEGTSPGEARRGFYIDNLDISGLCHLPYTDTFRYLYYKNNVVSSSLLGSTLNIIKYCDTYFLLTHTGNGGYFRELDPYSVKEVLTHNYISKKDAIKVKRYDGYVLKSNIVDIDNVYYSSYDTDVQNTELDGFILKDDVVNEAITNQTMSKKTSVHSPKYGGYIHKSNIVYIKGDVYHQKDTDNIICFNSKWYHISDCFINYDRRNLNRELKKETNKNFLKPPPFFDKDLPGEYMQYLSLIWSFAPIKDNKSVVERSGTPIPKKLATIAYNLAYNSTTGGIEYQEVYRLNKQDLIKLNTGELVLDSSDNRQYLKKFNNKWYIKEKFKLPDKNQLLLFG